MTGDPPGLSPELIPTIHLTVGLVLSLMYAGLLLGTGALIWDEHAWNRLARKKVKLEQEAAEIERQKEQLARLHHVIDIEQQPDGVPHVWQVVRAVLQPGTVSVGLRCGQQEMVYFFALHLPEHEANAVAAITA